VALFWQHIRLLFFNPPKAWRSIKKQNHNFGFLYWRMAFVMIALTSVCLFVGESLSTASTASGFYILADALLYLISNMLAFFITAKTINAIIPNYGGKKDLAKTGYLLFYTMAPFYMVMAVKFIFPSLLFLLLLPVYCLVVYYYGVRQMMNFAAENKTAYYLVSLLIIIGIHVIAYFVFNVAVLKLV